MAAERAQRKLSPIVLNRNSEVFQSYLEQRRPSRSGEYPFLDTLFREEVPVTTPAPEKFTGGATVYKASTPSSTSSDNTPIHNNIETNVYNYKIVKKAQKPITTPPLEIKPVDATKSTGFEEPSTQYVDSFNNQNISNIHSNTAGGNPAHFTNPVKTQPLPFPTFENQFYKYHAITTPAPPSKIIKEIENSFEPPVHSKNHFVHQGTLITTSRPKTQRPTQKYYMNLVTEQPYKPKQNYKKDENKGHSFSVGLSNVENVKAISTTVSTIDKPYLSQEYSSFQKYSPTTTILSQTLNSESNTEPTFYYKDISDGISSDFFNQDTVSIASNVPEKSHPSIEQSTDNANYRYVSIDTPKFYYKPVEQETHTEKSVFYYKPVVPKTQTKTIVYKTSNIEQSYNKPFFTSTETFATSDAPKNLAGNSESSSHSPVVSKIQYTTPHPLVYGFKPLRFETGHFTTLTSKKRFPKYLSSPSFPATPEVSKLKHFPPYPPPKKAFEEERPNFSISKPIRFPYDKRHYYSGRFVSTY